eukprot:983262-Prorocentrum_minimum.AAC.2
MSVNSWRLTASGTPWRLWRLTSFTLRRRWFRLCLNPRSNLCCSKGGAAVTPAGGGAVVSGPLSGSVGPVTWACTTPGRDCACDGSIASLGAAAVTAATVTVGSGVPVVRARASAAAGATARMSSRSESRSSSVSSTPFNVS